MNSKSIIPLSALIVASTITFADLNSKGEPPSTRQWLGLASVYLALSVGSDLGFAPANGFSGLLMVAVFLSRGQEALGYLGEKAGPPRKARGKNMPQDHPQIVEKRSV